MQALHNNQGLFRSLERLDKRPLQLQVSLIEKLPLEKNHECLINFLGTG